MSKFKYNVYRVGDGLFSVMENKPKNLNEINKSIFDIGYSNCKLFDAINQTDFSSAKTLVMSHFHRDHYNGIPRVANKSLSIENLIIPKLPFNNLIRLGAKSFLAIQLFYLGEITGFYETDLLLMLQRKNNRSFNIHRKESGDSFSASSIDYEVIWPSNKFITSIESIEVAINEITSVIQENDDFRKFYEEVINSRFFDETIESIEFDENVLDPARFQITLTKEQRKLIKSANGKLLRLANDICLAFQDKDKEFLSLGDLSNKALEILFISDFTIANHYHVILSAHHGTHFTNHKNWNNLTSCVVVHSNGKKMTKHFKTNYNSWSSQIHKTHIQSNFNSSPYLINCNINSIVI